MFDKNPFWDTMWTTRDQEFLWSGVKGGFCVGAILTTSICLIGVSIYANHKLDKRNDPQ